jgi:acetolactate synthase-1/2/3 large subunit
MRPQLVRPLAIVTPHPTARGLRSDIHEIKRTDASHLTHSIRQRAARNLIESLVAAGVDTYFGIPGGPAAPLFDALCSVEGARLIESRQETSAGFAASAYYRATGRVPAVIVTAGPGATQAVTGVVNAHLERVPMIVISGDVAWDANGGRLLQDSGPEGIAIEQMLARATRAQIRVARAESASSQALAALDAALDPTRPGPVLLVVPMHKGAADAAPGRICRGRRRVIHEVPEEAVQFACEMLAGASRPVIVLGAACHSQPEVIRRLVDALDVPFITTPRAKGVVSEEHPRSLRHGGLAASMWAREYTKHGVDVALVLGTDLDDVSIGPTPYVRAGGTLIHVDLDATVFNRNVAASLGVVAELSAFADAVRQRWTGEGMRNGKSSQLVRALKQTHAPVDMALFETDPHTPIAPHRVIADLDAALPDAVWVSDIGEHMLSALHYVTARGPDRFFIQLALGSMGSGIAGAIGMALGTPHRRVICVCGDGGMQMAGSEVLVAVRERLPIVFVVFNDGRYNMVHHGMKALYGTTHQWDTAFVDFAEWGRAMGIASCRIESPGEITSDLIDGLLDGGGPVILDVRIDREVRIRGAGRVEALQQMSSQDGGVR